MSSGIDPSHDYRHNFLGGLGRAGGGDGELHYLYCPFTVK